MTLLQKRLLSAFVVALCAVSGAYIVSLVLVPEPEPKPVAVIPEPEPEPITSQRVVGASVEGRDIELYTFGTGDTDLLFVGGIHGGYEWNSVMLAYNFIDYLTEHPEEVPEDLKVSVIPVLNPDGLYTVTGTDGRFELADVGDASDVVGLGRFNANAIDLNRNFDCKWQPESMWRGNTVSAGTGAFSEPEAAALRDVVTETSPKAVVFWHSQSNAVYASECEGGVLPETITVMDTYADAASYPAVDTFDAYSVTGDAEGWLASIGIPAVTVELSTHETIEWEKNLAGSKALFELYSVAK